MKNFYPSGQLSSAVPASQNGGLVCGGSHKVLGALLMEMIYEGKVHARN